MNDVLLSLKRELQKILDVIVDKDDVLYFDYPLHLNVGDLLIYAGTEDFFKHYNINVRLRRCLQAFDLNEVKKYLNKNTTIICHGGGNFGNLYPLIHQLREELVRNFPEHRIVVLPQTAYFTDSEAVEKSAQLFSRHNNCHLFARDTMTEKLMRKFSVNVTLCPDMAHQLYGMLPLNDTVVKSAVEKNLKNTLYFLRKDIEVGRLEKEIRDGLPSLENVKDWDDLLSVKDRTLELYLSRLSRIANRLRLSVVKDRINAVWYKHSLDIISRAADIFSVYDSVVTSRLHGHIFSCLLGIPNRICDNSYGKNLGYYNQWTKNIGYADKY